MTRINARHLDQRRLLLPRDCCTDPDLFGVGPLAAFHIPVRGDETSMCASLEQYLLLCLCNQEGPSAEIPASKFGTSKQTLSRVSRVER